MSKLFPRIVFICLLFLFANHQSKANHAYGADISYSNVGGSTYIITAQAYQDCNSTTPMGGGITLPSGLTGTGSGPCCAKDITPRSSTTCDACLNSSCSFGFGIKRWTISVKTDLSQSSKCQLTFYYSECCDNQSNNLYVECTINRCKGDQSGPSYQFDPVSIVCVNSIVDRYQSVKPGNDKDSIRYYFTDPLANAGAAISFSGAYSRQYPLSYTGTDPDADFVIPQGAGFHYDSLTGHLQFKPSKVESAYFALEADEYRKDSSGKYYLFGTTMRRANINIINCNENHAPVLTGINGSKHDSVTVCSNTPLSIRVNSFDIDTADVTQITNLNETGGTVSIDQPAHKWAAASFAWTPTNKDVRKQPYTLTLTASDNGTPVPGTVSRRYYIFVTDSFPVAEIKITDSGCGKYHLGLATPIDKNYKMDYKWLIDNIQVSTRDNYSYHTTLAGKHVVSLVLTKQGSCSRTISDTVYYDTAYHRSTPVVGICKGTSVQLNSISVKGATWSPGKTLSDSTIYNPVASPSVTTLYILKGTDKAGCAFTDQTNVVVSDFTIKKSADLHVCYGTLIKLYASASAPDAVATWTFPGGQIYPIKDTFTTYGNANEVYQISMNYNGCIKKDNIRVFVPDSVNISYRKKVCAGSDAVLTANGGTKYTWMDLNNNANVVSTTNSYTISPANDLTKAYRYQLEMKDSATGCLRYGTARVNVGTLISKLSGHNIATCPGSNIYFSVSGGNKYNWTLNGKTVSKNYYLSTAPLSSGVYHVLVEDSIFGCQAKDSVTVYVAPASAILPEHLVCSGNNTVLRENGGSSYYWSPATGLSSTTAASTIATPLSTTVYIVTVKDSITSCIRTDTVQVYVDKDCIWPGDANKDKTADYLDVLNIGLGYGTQGTARNTGDTQWQAYPNHDWTKSTIDGINYKHIDANGDGVINAGDTATISANYSKKHTKWTPGTGTPADPHVYFKFTKDTFYAGETATAYLYAGDAAHPLVNAYGIGFQAQHIADPMVANTAIYAPECGYFCMGAELNYFRPDYAANSTDATVVETKGNASPNTTGKFASVSFQLKDTLAYSYPATGQKIYAKLLSAMVIDKSGKEMSVYGMNDSAVVVKKKGKNGIAPSGNLNNYFNIYPNPAKDELILENVGKPVQKITIFNAFGQQILIIDGFAGNSKINVSTLPAGMYFIELTTENGTARQKILIQK